MIYIAPISSIESEALLSLYMYLYIRINIMLRLLNRYEMKRPCRALVGLLLRVAGDSPPPQKKLKRLQFFQAK